MKMKIPKTKIRCHGRVAYFEFVTPRFVDINSDDTTGRVCFSLETGKVMKPKDWFKAMKDSVAAIYLILERE